MKINEAQRNRCFEKRLIVYANQKQPVAQPSLIVVNHGFLHYTSKSISFKDGKKIVIIK